MDVDSHLLLYVAGLDLSRDCLWSSPRHPWIKLNSGLSTENMDDINKKLEVLFTRLSFCIKLVFSFIFKTHYVPHGGLGLVQNLHCMQRMDGLNRKLRLLSIGLLFCVRLVPDFMFKTHHTCKDCPIFSLIFRSSKIYGKTMVFKIT